MNLNKSKGNMYGFVTHTWNPIKGTCPHGCEYCYMKRILARSGGDRPQRLVESELSIPRDSPKDKYIFVGSSTDAWAEAVPQEWLDKVYDAINTYDATYLLQSKNPGRFVADLDRIPNHTWIGTTIETNRPGYSYNAPTQRDRLEQIVKIKGLRPDIRILLTAEPVISFDRDDYLDMILSASPDMFAIGADSGRNGLDEPTRDDVEWLVESIRSVGVKIYIKKNLNRITDKYASGYL